MSEYIGYLGSGLVLISFLMKDIFVLRIVNTIGCLVFIIYGSMIDSLPVIITNAAIVLVNLYYLISPKLKSSSN